MTKIHADKVALIAMDDQQSIYDLHKIYLITYLGLY